VHPDHTIKPRRLGRDYLVRLLGECMDLLDQLSKDGMESTDTLADRVANALDRERRATPLRSRAKAKG
jgi:hypothetical protein